MSDIKTIANNLYTACLDLDFCDYEETKEHDISSLETALKEPFCGLTILAAKHYLKR